MTNWQKQVNSQLRLTPLFQLILVNYQSNFRYRRDTGRKRQHRDTSIGQYGNHSSLRDPGSTTSSALFFGSPHPCRYACDSLWEKPLETPTKQASYLTPQTRRKHEPAEETPGRSCVTGNPRTRFLSWLGCGGPCAHGLPRHWLD